MIPGFSFTSQKSNQTVGQESSIVFNPIVNVASPDARSNPGPVDIGQSLPMTIRDDSRFEIPMGPSIPSFSLPSLGGGGSFDDGYLESDQAGGSDEVVFAGMFSPQNLMIFGAVGIGLYFMYGRG